MTLSPSRLAALPLTLLAVVHGTTAQCMSPQSTELAVVKDAPVFDSVNSIISAGNLTITFDWASYGPTARLLDDAGTGFVLQSNGSVCNDNSVSYAAVGSTAYDESDCTDYSYHEMNFETLISVCADAFTADDTGSAKTWDFLYRLTHVEALSSGHNRTIINVYPIQVVQPTTVTVSSVQYVFAGLTTIVVSQEVDTDNRTNGYDVDVIVQMACDNAGTVNSVVAPSGLTVTGGALVQGVDNGNGICDFDTTLVVFPDGSTCELDGNYTIVYTVTYPDMSEQNVSHVIVLDSGDFCSKSVITAAISATLVGYEESARTTVKGAGEVVTVGSNAYWRLTPSLTAVSDLSDITLTSFSVSLDGAANSPVLSFESNMDLSYSDAFSDADDWIDFDHVWAASIFGAAQSTVAITVQAIVDFPTSRKRAELDGASSALDRAVDRAVAELPAHETWARDGVNAVLLSSVQLPFTVTAETKRGEGEIDEVVISHADDAVLNAEETGGSVPTGAMSSDIFAIERAADVGGGGSSGDEPTSGGKKPRPRNGKDDRVGSEEGSDDEGSDNEGDDAASSSPMGEQSSSPATSTVAVVAIIASLAALCCGAAAAFAVFSRRRRGGENDSAQTLDASAYPSNYSYPQSTRAGAATAADVEYGAV